MSAARLNVHRTGSGEPLVLLHGIGDTLRTWEPVVPALAAEHEVIAIDLAGFGDSPPLPPGVRASIMGHADALQAELDALGVERPHAAGNSLGGWIALELARRGRVRSVVALSPGGMQLPRERMWTVGSLRLSHRLARLMRPLHGVVARSAALRTLTSAQIYARPWRIDPDVALHTLRNFADSPGFHPTLRCAVEDGNARGLDEIRVPVRIAWGTRDRLLPPREAKRFVRVIRGAELVCLPGLGHVPMPDDPAVVAETIVAFTRAHARASDGPAAPHAAVAR